MSGNELVALSRAHELFAGRTRSVAVDARLAPYDGLLERAAALNTAAGRGGYQSAVNRSRDDLRAAATADAAVAGTVKEAHRDHANAHGLTKGVLDEARADTALPDNPIAQREAIRRRVARLRAQQAHVLAARRKSRRHRSRWRAVRYRMLHHGAYPAGLRLPSPNSRAGVAVRAALSRLGRPYVWGATGPDQFDCSGLTQWSYARAGIHLDRTTYQQIYDGSRSRAHRSVRATWSSPPRGTCNWRSVTTWWSKPPTPARRCGSVRSAPACRSVVQRGSGDGGRARTRDARAGRTRDRCDREAPGRAVDAAAGLPTPTGPWPMRSPKRMRQRSKRFVAWMESRPRSMVRWRIRPPSGSIPRWVRVSSRSF